MAEFWASTYGFALSVLLQGLAIIAFVMGSLIFMVYGDRKIWAAVQMRRGPNVVGPWGLLQTFADALKYIVKEIVIPAGADKFIFFLAPFLSMMLALFAFVAIPFDEGWVMANINVGILFIFAASSLEVYGWASWSKDKAIFGLRNPSDKPQTYYLNLMKDFEIPKGEASRFTLQAVYGSNPTVPVNYQDAAIVTLQPLETLVFEATPVK